jgi:hypothetical protein
MNQQKLHRKLEKRVPGLISIITVFAVVELAILLICIAYSANQDIIKIYDSDHTLIYEDNYNAGQITEFKKLYGISDFKAEGFTLARVGVDNQFPTRAWIALSICIPLFLILFVVFVVNVFTDIFDHKKESPPAEPAAKDPFTFEETRFEKLFSTLGRLNIYALGGTVILIAFLYWMIPDMILFLGKVSYKTVLELKWVLVVIAVFLGVYLIVKTILSHRTQAIIIQQQAEIQKNRDKLLITAKMDRHLLENSSHTNGSQPTDDA